MKVRASLKIDPSKGDKIVRRKGRLYVISKDPNRKQRQKGRALKK